MLPRRFAEQIASSNSHRRWLIVQQTALCRNPVSGVDRQFKVSVQCKGAGSAILSERSPPEAATVIDTLLPKRRSTRGYKGRRRVPMLYDTAELLVMFDCADVNALLAKLEALGISSHITLGPGYERCVFVSEYQLPEHMQ